MDLTIGFRRGFRNTITAGCFTFFLVTLFGNLPLAVAGERMKPVVRIAVRINMGEDIGQNYGTLFEGKGDRGNTIFGAGFTGAYNTRYRLDRFVVQFYIRPKGGDHKFTVTTLPRPSDDCGTYMFNLEGKLFSFAEEHDRRLRAWDEMTKLWRPEPAPLPHRMRIGKGILVLDDQEFQYDGRTILSKPGEGHRHSFYYATGRLFFYHTRKVDDGGYTRIWALPWTPRGGEPADPALAEILTTPIPGESTFCWGQLGPRVLTVSNLGGVYVFNGRAWTVLRTPQKGVSYQVYSMLNYHDQLLLGQYPTGELFEYDGASLRHLEGWPPRIKGVSADAREAQTMAIYGGDLYVGVWPWGELWRYDPNERRWISMGRLFTHPPVSDKVTHPYEAETVAAKGAVLNQWGQRITSMVPLGDSLMVSTSAKANDRWEPRFEFLADDKWKEYGRVVRLTVPGNLSAPIAWKDGPTELEFVITRDRMMILQDSTCLAETAIAPTLTTGLKSAKITWGRGVFGSFAGKLLAQSVE